MTTLYGTFPILIPGTSTSFSTNGLKKTTGTILYKPGQEAQALLLAKQKGSVFPEPQIRTTDARLLEMSFDAYSGTGKDSRLLGSRLVKVSKTLSGFATATSNSGQQYYIITSCTVVETWVVDTITIFSVISAEAGASQIPNPTVTLTNSLKRRDVIGQVGSTSLNGPPQSTTLNITWTQVLADVTRRNFGDLDEVDVTFTLEPTVN
jgi:hypothetical protein